MHSIMLHHSAVGSAESRLGEDTMVAVAVLTGRAALGLVLAWLHRDEEDAK